MPTPKQDAVQIRKILVEPENWDAARVFARMMTQWRMTATQIGKHFVMVRTGLDMPVLQTVAAALEIPLNEALLSKVQEMEVHALNVFNERLTRQLRGDV